MNTVNLNNNINFILVFWLWVGVHLGSIQSVNSQNFDPIIRRAWNKNAQLKSINFQLDAANMALKEAKALYGPNIAFVGQYTLANGGRTIQFPVGDLLNPVYSTLNQITSSNAFPQISNVSEQFFPNNFYDAKIRISQPIFYPDLAINKQLKSETMELKKLEIKAFKRQLAQEAIMSYILYQSSKKVVEIYDTSKKLLEEAKRTTQSMMRNGIAIPTALSRIETQEAIVEAQHIEAKTNVQNAQSYLDFMVGQEAASLDIVLDDLPTMPLENAFTREEIQQLNQSIKLFSLAQNKEDRFYLPKIGGLLDVGSQAFDFGFEPYILVGLNLEVNIFDNKQHQYRKEAAKANIQSSVFQKQAVEDQISVQVKQAERNLKAAIDQAKTFEGRLLAIDKIYREVYSRYKEGVVGYLELMDAQVQLTQINIQNQLAKENAWIKWSEHMYATASYPIENE